MSLWRRYDAMVFDVDAVIGPTTALHAAAWARVFDEFAVALARDEGQRFEPFDVGTDFRYVEGRAGCDAVAAFLASRGLDLPPGHPDDPPEAQTCWGLGNRKRVYFAEAVTEHRIEVFPDAVALIRVLAHAGKHLALVCADESCDALLARAGLLDHFPVRVTDDAAARWGLAGKPAPDTLLKAADLLGVLAADAIVVEDSVAGVRAGQAGGFGLVVGVDRHDAPDGLSMSGADVVVRDLRELITMDEPAPVRARRRRRPPWETTTLFEAILLVAPAEGFGNDAVLRGQVDTVLGRLHEHGVDVAVTEPGEDPAPRLAWMVSAAQERGVGPGLVLATGWLSALELPAGAERASVVSVLPNPPPGPFPPSMRWTGGGASACLALLKQQADRRDAGLVPGVDLDPAWTVTVHGDDPNHRRVHQSLLTVSDTRFGTRGVREEEGLGSLPRVLAVGVFDDTATPSELLQGPTWTGLHLLDQLATDGDRRTLDLRGGVLFREMAAEPVPLRTLRFASLARPGCFAMRAEGAVDWLHIGHALIPPATDGTFTRTQRGQISQAQMDTGAGGLIAAATVQRERNACGRRVVERLAFYAADPDGRPMMDKAKAGLADADRLGFEALLAEHRTAWARRWDDALVCIDGDPEMQLAVRFSLFQLMASVPTSGEAAVGARGVSGASYRGHVFWDADVFALPFFAATCPPAARAMLEYRLRRLGPAYRAAAERGLRGARFPWESARTGVDVTPRVERPPHGPPIPIYTGEHEEHIVADVAWAAWQYAAWTGEKQFLHGAGRPLLLDTARYWASRIRVDEAGRGHIDDVIGPDEYHERVDDNVFTNVIARWNLRRAAELADEIIRHDKAMTDGDAGPERRTRAGEETPPDALRRELVTPAEVA
ncbi:MAG: HAD-IA family hydrolase, partial [Kineosporiaceae bacterium]